MPLPATGRPLFLAPMADVTEPAFRGLARDHGADVTCSEMVAAAGLVHHDPATHQMVMPWPGEHPYGVQLMGGDADQVAKAVGRAAALVPDLDFVDLNMGCPSPNILRSCAGGFLLADPPLAGRILRAAKDAAEAAGVPHISAKMRLGPDHDRLTYLEVGEAAEAAGASWVTLHGRTVEQAYRGQADWDAIGRLVDRLGIPVLGNGDLHGPEEVAAMGEQTGCAGFFIARAAMRDPTVFRRMRQALDGQTPDPPPTPTERLRVVQDYLARARLEGVRLGIQRRQATRLVAGAPGGRRLRTAFHTARDADALQAAVEEAL